MKKPLHVIYVPGLGDQKVTNQQRAINTWRWYGVESEIFQMKWADGEAWDAKFERLLARIDAAVKDGKDVALVGASAGGSAVINAYEARKDVIAGVVCISGKINHPQSIKDHYKKEDPAFITSAYDCAVALETLNKGDRKRILSRYALADAVVPPKDSRIPGAHNHKVPSVGHFLTISTQLIFGAPSFLHFLKKQAKQR